jgi:hypothetical protein
MIEIFHAFVDAAKSEGKDLFDLNLPTLEPSEKLLPSPKPTLEEQIAHAEFLLSTMPKSIHADRLARMNPEPFVFA